MVAGGGLYIRSGSVANPLILEQLSALANLKTAEPIRHHCCHELSKKTAVLKREGGVATNKERLLATPPRR
jgi:hypothetical protein